MSNLPLPLETAINGQQVISSGQIILGLNESARLTVGGGSGALTLNVTFTEDNSRPRGLNLSSRNQAEGEVEFVNWNSPLGDAFTSPQKVADFQGADLLLNAVVHAAGPVRILTYLFIRGQRQAA